MKLFCFLLLLIITIEYIQSKKTLLRTYTIHRDNVVKANQLSAYTIYDSSGKNILYRLKPISTDIDTIVVTDHPAKNMVANLEGKWIAKVFHVTFSIYDKKLNEWIDGIIKKDLKGFKDKYSVEWNSKHLNTKSKLFSSKMQVYNTQQKELVAEFGHRDWFNSGNIVFALKIYSDQVSDIIYFFLLAINDHRIQEATSG
jgi:hypothetical protein